MTSSPTFEGKEAAVQADWDVYWSSQQKVSNKVYEVFADFYRNRIIKPALNHFIYRHFPSSSTLLHAGCGSGKVDMDVIQRYHITALDISAAALKIYKEVHPQQVNLVQASIFQIPMEDGQYDGIYNLGVMEHFTEEEIQQILLEFGRILKKNGKIVLFVPPVFGLTVMVLDTAHFILNKLFRRNVKLHPDEITRVKSRSHIKGLVEKAGFEFVDYYFGIRDLFTQAVIVAKKR
jgi:ubiquinone/menaquinone biosynthesis C-methylase UbiE